MATIETDKTELYRFKTWWDGHWPHSDSVITAWSIWRARAALDTGFERDALKAIEDECWDLRCFDIPTGGDDYDVEWRVISHWQATPHERVESYGSTPMEALLGAMNLPQCGAPAPQPPASASAEPLGRFGHHPDPALDFCIEVEEIEGEAENIRVGFENGTPSRDELHSRIERAMEFRVGGDEGAMRAKDRLREIEARFNASASAAVDHEQRSVSSNDTCISQVIGNPDFVATLQGYASMCESAARGDGLSPDDCGMVVEKLRDAAFVIDALQKLRDEKISLGWKLVPSSTAMDTAPPIQPVAMSVMPLEWEREIKHGLRMQIARSPSLGVVYEVSVKQYSPGWIATFGGLDIIYDGGDEDEAKAAAQADYEQRIRSALVIELAQPDAYRQGAEAMRKVASARLAALQEPCRNEHRMQAFEDALDAIRVLPLPEKEG